MGVDSSPYPRELLKASMSIWEIEPQTQANLRRATSTAYYALFHLLIEAACRNWERTEQHAKLARVFEHRTMAAASSRRIAEHRNATGGSVEFRLYQIATTFRDLQDRRHMADYDLSLTLSAGTVREWIAQTEIAFDDWDLIRDEQIAHDYLFSLLFREKDRT